MTTLRAIDAAVATGADADDVLRAAVAALVAEPGVAWAGISFVEQGVLVLGPCAGVESPAHRARVPIVYGGDVVGELAADGIEVATLERAAELLAAHVLLGWDTGGEAWEP